MENEQELFIDKAREVLKQNLRWGGMFLVLGYIFVGLLLLMGFFATFFLSQSVGFAALLALIVYVLMAMMYYFPLRRLNGFLHGCRDSLETGNEAYFIEGLFDLSRSMRLIVIYALVAIGLYAIIFGVFFLVGAYSDFPAI